MADEDHTTYSLRPIPGTPNYLIRHHAEGAPVVLVAEVVEHPEGYTLYRMDATGVLGFGIPDPESALAHYERWVRETGTEVTGVHEH